MKLTEKNICKELRNFDRENVPLNPIFTNVTEVET